MTPRRRLLASASALVAVAALSGCERPTPIATVVSGTVSEWKEADRWCFEDAGECVEGRGDQVEIPVRPGENVGVDVSKDLVERGWFVELAADGGEPQQGPLQEDSHYFSFTAPNVGEGGAELTVVALSEDGQEEAGRFVFQLVPEE